MTAVLSLFLFLGEGEMRCPDYSIQKSKLKASEKRSTRSPGECEKAGLLLCGRLVILLLLVRWSDNKSRSALQHRPRLICPPPPPPHFSCFTNRLLTFTCLFHSKQTSVCLSVLYMSSCSYFSTRSCFVIGNYQYTTRHATTGKSVTDLELLLPPWRSLITCLKCFIPLTPQWFVNTNNLVFIIEHHLMLMLHLYTLFLWD